MNLSENEKYHTIFINEDGKNKVLLFDHATLTTTLSSRNKRWRCMGGIISSGKKLNYFPLAAAPAPQYLYIYNLVIKKLKILLRFNQRN